MTKGILAADPTYREMTKEYGKKDGILAICLYVFVILLYLAAGYLRMAAGFAYAPIVANLLLIAIVLILVRVRGQKLGTVGLRGNRFKPALLAGVIAGVVVAVGVNILPVLLSGGGFVWIGFGALLFNIFQQILSIAFQEELLFRGFLQTRLSGLIKSDIAVVIVSGLMFAGMHIPFQLFNYGGGDIIAFFSNYWFWLFTTFVWHFLFVFLYRKFNSLTAPVACHFLMNISSSLVG